MPNTSKTIEKQPFWSLNTNNFLFTPRKTKSAQFFFFSFPKLHVPKGYPKNLIYSSQPKCTSNHHILVNTPIGLHHFLLFPRAISALNINQKRVTQVMVGSMAIFNLQSSSELEFRLSFKKKNYSDGTKRKRASMQVLIWREVQISSWYQNIAKIHVMEEVLIMNERPNLYIWMKDPSKPIKTKTKTKNSFFHNPKPQT